MSSKPLFTLATYFSRRSGVTSGPPLGKMPPRPDGTVVWIWATDPGRLAAIEGLVARLTADGDLISVVVTLPNLPDDTALADRFQQAPLTRSQTQRFLAHWRPVMLLWMGDGLEPAVLVEAAKEELPCILLEATNDVIHPEHGGWLPGLPRAMLQQFDLILTVDAAAMTVLLRTGADPNKVEPLGLMETAPTTLPYFEDERQEIAKALGSRPVWLAADTDFAEIDMLADAHHHASLRSHRLLLIVTLTSEEDGPRVAERLREKGFLVALRSADEELDDAIQIYVADFEGEMGLWYRLAPLTYLGKSLSGGPCRNPYEAATLGSAILHGPDIAPYEPQISRLKEADACVPVDSPDFLGPEIETYLAPDKAALVVHAAWEVTSRGAEITARVAEMIMARLDALET